MLRKRKFLNRILTVSAAAVALGAMAFSQVVPLWQGVGGTAAADPAGQAQVKELTGDIDTQIEKYLDPSVVSALPDTVKDTDEISVIVKSQEKTILDAYEEKGKTVGSVADFSTSSAGKAVSDRIAQKNASLYRRLKETGIELRAENTYDVLMSGFEVVIQAKDFDALSEALGDDATAIVSEVYEPCETQLVENDVNVFETGIFDSSNSKYDGTGTVVAVLDTGLDYTHSAFSMDTFTSDNRALSLEDVAAVIGDTRAAETTEGLNAEDVYLNERVPYAYDYADKDPDVYPIESEHGTHVSGIILGKDDTIRGVAPNAQLVSMKVFSDTQTGARNSWILAALEDCVTLGVDVINMSLGTACGFSREVDREEFNVVYDKIAAKGISLVAAASNDYNSTFGSEKNGNLGLTSNPDSGTVGSPSTYEASLSVASISGVKTPYFLLSDGTEIYFRESRLVGKTDENDFVGGMLGDAQEGTFDFVVVPGVGYEANYNGIDVNGKIAVVRRGGNTFEQKVAIAKNKGAKGIIIYNNVSGMLNMSVGTQETIPSCLISMDYGDILVEAGTGTISLSKDYLAGPFMSDFSSWGVLPNLTLSPDITAHGGEITSSYPGGNEYDTISGTSMACPNLAGALILVRQYVKDMDSSLTTSEIRDLSYSLLMSTATIANNEYGNPYSPRKQGAGLADIKKSVTTKAYLTVDGSNKPKLSLGDDPNRSGVYTLEFNITNLAGEALSYDFDPVVFTESMSSDDRTVAELAYLLDADYSYSVVATEGNASLNGNNLSLGGYSSAKITITLTLSQEAKDYIDANFVNGMYVEGYVRLNSLNADGIGLNLPFLAFYGNWADAPMLDVTEYEVGASQEDSSVLAEDKLVEDVYATLPMAGFASQDQNGNDTIGSWGLGAFGYNLAQGYTAPVTVERYASLTSSEDGNYMLYSISAGLLRGAKRIEMQIADSVTGEVIWTKTGYNGRKSHSSGGEQSGGYIQVEFDVRELGLANNAKYTFSMECFLDWGDGNQGNRNTFSFEFTIDNEKPVILDTYVRNDGDDKIVEFNVYDNHYLQGYIVYTYEDLDENGNPTGLTSVTNGVIPVYNGEFNSSTRISLDVTAYWSLIEKNGGKLYVQFMDYAKNSTTGFVTLLLRSTVRSTLRSISVPTPSWTASASRTTGRRTSSGRAPMRASPRSPWAKKRAAS